MSKKMVIIFGVALLAIIFVYRKLDQVEKPSLQNVSQIEVLAKNLDTPWDLVFLQNGEILFTEREGNLKLRTKEGEIKQIAKIDTAFESGEGGLLGIALHPDFEKNHYIYLYFTSFNKNQIVRFSFENNQLIQNQLIFNSIPKNLFHNGGRIKFGPDNKLYITTGDAQNSDLSQDVNSFAGKILRLNDDGSIPSDNPFPNSPVYSLGHRNPQGLTWNKDGQLFETEHGNQAFDEVNKISPGKNFGWPKIKGDETNAGFEVPFLHSGTNTWAPSGVEIKDDYLYFTGLRGSAIYRIDLKTLELKEFFKNEFGRIRTINLGTDGYFYILTNNRDGRGKPEDDDDRIVKISPNLLK